MGLALFKVERIGSPNQLRLTIEAGILTGPALATAPGVLAAKLEYDGKTFYTSPDVLSFIVYLDPRYSSVTEATTNFQKWLDNAIRESKKVIEKKE